MRRSTRACLTLLTSAILVGAAAAQPEPDVIAANRSCLGCHSQPHIAELTLDERLAMVTGPAPTAADPQDPRPGLLVTPDALTGTPHAGLRCVECHRDSEVIPHARLLAPVSCTAQCHEKAGEAFAMSIHGEALSRGDPLAPNCVTCHLPHQTLPPTDRRSSVHPLNVVRICGDCHEQHTAPNTNGTDPHDNVIAYMDSVHGRGVSQAGLVMAATCADCHGHHAIRAAGDPLAATSREGIPQMCGGCHLGVVETYAQSVHGQALAAGRELAPVCTDCHAGHEITRASTPEHHLDIVAECGDCHDRSELSGGRRASFYRTYRRSYHGQVTELGSTRAARCSDCHGAHDILPLSDPGSRLHGERLVETCRSCHPKANASFARFDPHADYLDRERYPLLNGVWWYFILIMSAAFGFFGLHTILWFIRSSIERVRHGPPVLHEPQTVAIRRFTKLNRLNHALVIITFLGLVCTGIPLLFAEQAWAAPLAALLGGVAQAGFLHRLLAILLMINFAIHFYGLFRSVRHHPGRWTSWLFGPNTMLPRIKDFKDCAGMFRWFFRGGARPAFGRWTYWEKFDYWAEIGGSAIIGGSGFLLWFPEFFARFLPGWIFNVAMIVHGYEALLALGFIFTIHFFNAHLRLEKFPVDDVIFTGSLPEEEFRHERPEQYEQLVATGRLDELLVPAPPRWQRRVAVGVAVIAMAIGIAIVALIIRAGLGMLRNGA